MGARAALPLALVACAACHPLSLFHPPALRLDRSPAPPGGVEILVDKMGVPHIYGAGERGLAYGLGFMHARDRLFQIITLRHAARGRLAELFGQDLLDVDRRLRLISWGLDAQYAALGERDRALAESYAAGVNAGAAHAGRSAEMAILGLTWEPFTGPDSLAIARLQAWDLAADFRDELARSRILAHLPEGDPRRPLFLQPMPSGGVPIVRKEEHSGEITLQEPPRLPDAALASDPEQAPRLLDAALASDPARFSPASTQLESDDAARRRGGAGADSRPPQPIAEMFDPRGEGASNSWAVHASRTATGRAILCNDPHLAHRLPGVFYLAHLEAPDFTLAGATFPGVPAVLIGATRRLAWGMTTSVTDNQDLVRIAPDPNDADAYLLDGASTKFEKFEQTFRIGHGEKTREVKETWRGTEFGPVLPAVYDPEHEPGETLALMWPGFWSKEGNAEPIAGFWDLARAETPAQAGAAVEKISISGQNVTLAFTDGEIAYRLAALVPVRRSAETNLAPRDGRTREGGWQGLVPPAQRPQLTNPARGYIVTANQRVVEDDGPAARHLGGTAGTPDRARRITERLSQLLAEKKPTAEELLAIQQDVVAVDARELAPLLAANCPAEVIAHPAERARAFCRALREFHGRFDVASPGALPFALTLDELRRTVLETHFGPELVPQLMDPTFLRTVVDTALRDELAGRPSLLFDDPATPEREGLAPFVARAVRRALDFLVEKAGPDPSDWWWGKLHRLAFKAPLAAAPLIGAWFQTEPHPESGHRTAIRAERGLPITNGSALRMVVEMTTPPTLRIAIDTGQSGNVGDPHLADQTPLWREGKPFRISTDRAEIERDAAGRLTLSP